MSQEQQIEKAKEHFGNIVKEQLDRVEKLKQGSEQINFSKKSLGETFKRRIHKICF